MRLVEGGAPARLVLMSRKGVPVHTRRKGEMIARPAVGSFVSGSATYRYELKDSHQPPRSTDEVLVGRPLLYSSAQCQSSVDRLP